MSSGQKCELCACNFCFLKWRPTLVWSFDLQRILTVNVCMCNKWAAITSRNKEIMKNVSLKRPSYLLNRMSNKGDITIKPWRIALWGSEKRQSAAESDGDVRYLVINQSSGQIKNLTWRWSSWLCVTNIIAIHPVAINSSLHHRYLPCPGANWAVDFRAKRCANSQSRYWDIPPDGLKIWPGDGLVN